ncbi:MAG: phage protease [Phycisphaerales bacterium]
MACPTQLTSVGDRALSLRLTAQESPGSWLACAAPVSVPADANRPAHAEQRFVKDIIRDGQYVKMSDNATFSVDAGVRQHFINEFSRMKSAGVRVPLPFTHKDGEWEQKARAGDPRDNSGWVDDIWSDGDALKMSCTIIGEDAIAAARRSDVSIYVPVDFTDGRGNKYERPITHIALCTDPVIPGLGQFVPLAASQRASLSTGDQPMGEFLKALAASLGLDPKAMTDEKAGMDLVIQAIKKNSEDTKSLKASLEAEKAKAPAATAEPKPAPEKVKASPMVVKLMGKTRQQAIDALFSQRKITPDQVKSLTAEWVEDKALAASLDRCEDGSDFDRQLAILEKNTPYSSGSQTGGQTVVLPLSQGAGDDMVVKNAQARREAWDKAHAVH